MANPTWQKWNTALLSLPSSQFQYMIKPQNSATEGSKTRIATSLNTEPINSQENKSICRVIITRDSKPHHLHPSLTQTQGTNPHLPAARSGHLFVRCSLLRLITSSYCITPAQLFLFHPSWMTFIIKAITFTAWFFEVPKHIGVLCRKSTSEPEDEASKGQLRVTADKVGISMNFCDAHLNIFLLPGSVSSHYFESDLHRSGQANLAKQPIFNL